jgi:hypothetical protein
VPPKALRTVPSSFKRTDRLEVVQNFGWIGRERELEERGKTTAVTQEKKWWVVNISRLGNRRNKQRTPAPCSSLSILAGIWESLLANVGATRRPWWKINPLLR